MKKNPEIIFDGGRDTIQTYSSIFALSSPKFDRILLISISILVMIGLLMVYSASNAFAMERYGDSIYYLKRQIISCCISVIVMIFTMFFDYRMYQKLAWLFIFISIILLMLIYIPNLGIKSGGSTRWLKLGRYSFQPVEFVKISLIIYIARFLSQKAEDISNFKRGILPVLIVLSIFLILIYKQPDFGSVILISLITFLMLFVGGVKFYQIGLLVMLAGIFIGYEIWQEPYRLKRWLAFIEPWKDPEGIGYHIIQSFYAFGAGGIFGSGLGAGIQKLHYLPTPHTDFIFSIIGEELGLVGTITIVSLFMIFVWRGIHISLSVQDRFGKLLAFGISCLIAFQAFINMAVATGTLPTKGLTLPFISFGGSSLLGCLASTGILLNISRSRKGKNQDDYFDIKSI